MAMLTESTMMEKPRIMDWVRETRRTPLPNREPSGFFPF